MSPKPCPVCLNAYQTKAQIAQGAGDWGYRLDCPICGRFDLDREANDDFLDPMSAVGSKLSTVKRARIAHRLRDGAPIGPANLPRLTSEFLEQFIKEGCPGPSPSEQATNAIKYIGEEVSQSGERINSFPQYFFALIGAPNPSFAGTLLFELKQRGLVDGIPRNGLNTAPELLDANLTLDGWQVYEAEKRGKVTGNYGFMAMKFGDDTLDVIARDTIKPTIKEELGYKVRDMRDVARAGIIDNIMRGQIRDAAFVIVDLTHDNSGAYWEAGYAEGLNKPTIYICETTKFDLAKTHFDTNHCTTLIWARDDLSEFRKQLVATLKRTLNLF